MNDFDIDAFLSANFSKIEQKEQNKTKHKTHNKTQNKHQNKTDNKEVHKMSPSVQEPTSSVMIDIHMDNVIDNQIYDSLSITNNLQPNNVNNILLPLFPNDKVYNAEFVNSDKTLLLDKFVGNKSVGDKNHKVSNKFKISKTVIEQLKTDKSLNYQDLNSSMHQMWKNYILSLLNNTNQADTIYSKMVKADLHGAKLEIVQSSNKNQIGVSGIVMLETRRCFVVLTNYNKIKTLLKKGSVFRVAIYLNNQSVDIVGDNFMYKAVERTKAKYKTKYIL